MRFRKSIKITKGVRINFSKSGASLSLGGRGHSVNIGKRGVRSTIGIPGTGISYTTSTKSKRTGSSKRVTQKSTSQGKSSQFLVHLDMAGKVSILDPSTERPITDEATLRRIRSSQSFKDIKAELENDRQRKLTQIYNSSHEENKKFISIHRLAAPVDRMADYIRQRENIQLHKYQRDEFSKQKPSEEEIRSRLEMEALTAVSTKAFWKASSLRKQYVNDRLSVQYQEAVETWEAEKAAFESGQDAIEQKRNAEFAEEYNENVDYMNRIIEGDYETVCDAIDAWLEDLSLPVEIDVNYDFYPSPNNVLQLDVQLPDMSALNQTEIVKLKTGIKEKKKTQATLKQEYASLCFSIALFLAASMFNLSPAINYILLSGYVPGRDKAGDYVNNYIYSI